MQLFKNFTEVVQGKISSSDAILFSIAKQLLQFLVESIMTNYFEFRPAVQEMSLTYIFFLFLALVPILFSSCLVKAIAVHIQNKFTQMFIIMTLFNICLDVQASLSYHWLPMSEVTNFIKHKNIIKCLKKST